MKTNKKSLALIGVVLGVALAFSSLLLVSTLDYANAEAQETTAGYESGNDAATKAEDAHAFLLASAARKSPAVKKTEFPICYEIRWNANYWHRPELALKDAENLRRFVALLQKYGLKGDFFFTGLAADQLNQIAPDVVQKIKDFCVVVGHHGANRDPKPQPMDRVKGKSWNDAVRAMLDYETHAIDPVTGELDYTRLGGAAGIQTIFNRPIIATGRGAAAPILYVMKQFGARLCIGLPDMGGDVNQEHLRFMGVINIPELQVPGISFHGDFRNWVNTDENPLKQTEEAINALDRSKYVQIRIQPLGHDNDLLSLRTMWGPNAEEMPAEQQQKTWQKLEETFAFLSSHKEWVNITLADTLSFAVDDRNRQVTAEMLEKAVGQISTVTTTLPDYVTVGDDALSLADMFQALAYSLARYSSDNSLPKLVEVRDILGPTYRFTETNVGTQVATGDMLKAAATVVYQLEDRVPGRMALSGTNIEVNPAQFLVAMARVYEELVHRSGAKSVTLEKVSVFPKRVQPPPPAAEGGEAQAGRRDRSDIDDTSRLQYWTIKPVRWDLDKVLTRAEQIRKGQGRTR